MIPFLPKTPDGKTATTVKTAEGEVLTAKGATTQRLRIDRGGFGIDVQLDKPLTVKLGQNSTILIQLVEPAVKPTPAGKIGLKYKLVPSVDEARTCGKGMCLSMKPGRIRCCAGT